MNKKIYILLKCSINSTYTLE